MNIPDKAVEAAAKAKASGYGSYPAPAKRSIREEVRPILEAAAPFIAAQALRDEAKNWTAGSIRGLMLIAADELEAGK